MNKLPDHAAGISDCENVIGNILGHDALRADHGVFTDTHAGHDDDPRGDPRVVADIHILVDLQPLRAQVSLKRVVRGSDRDVRPEHHPIADVDMSVVHQGQVGICVDMRPEVKMRVAPVGTKGQLDITALAARGKDLFHIRLLFLMIGRFELIEDKHTLPSSGFDGFYMAKLKRLA